MQVESKQLQYLSTVTMDHKEKRHIVQATHEYLHPDTSRWYQSRGLPYRRGYLFHGPPGTGKSSLCLAIASMAYLDIYIISLGAVGLDENNLAVLSRSLPERCIVLVEDVDEAGIQKRRPNSTPAPEVVDLNEKPSHNRADILPQGSGVITLSAFLNATDGVSAKEGRILVMSTNHNSLSVRRTNKLSMLHTEFKLSQLKVWATISE